MPCDTVFTLKSAYKAEHADALVRAAARVGLEVVHRTERGRVLLEGPDGQRIDVQPAQVQLYGGATEGEAAALMRAYAEEVFDEWVKGYPDTYQEQTSTAQDGSRLFAVGKSDGGGY